MVKFDVTDGGIHLSDIHCDAIFCSPLFQNNNKPKKNKKKNFKIFFQDTKVPEL
jgi:hypothetical protein